MKRFDVRSFPVCLTLIALFALLAVPAAHADDDEIPWDVAEVFFELNNTDGDLGIHARIGGEPWKKLEIEDPNEREYLQIDARSRLRRQGMSEIMFESAEPTFDELNPERFFRRFPEGIYEVEGVSLEGDELESETLVTHLMPAPPVVRVNGLATPEDCDQDPVPAVDLPVTISWDPVTLSHPDLGRRNEPIDVVLYQVVLEREEPTPVVFSINLPADTTSVQLPPGIADSGDEWKLEVLVREASSNQTAIETCFKVD